MAFKDWSTTAALNATLTGINWAEGMPPAAVNNSARQMMADLAAYRDAAPRVVLTDNYLATDPDMNLSFTRSIVKLAAIGGGELVIPPLSAGFYTISDEITVSSGIVLSGFGKPLIKQVTNGKRAFIGVDKTDVGFRGFKLQGAGSATAFSSGMDDGLINFTASAFGLSKNIRAYDLEIYNAITLLALWKTIGMSVEKCDFHNWLIYGVLGSSSCNARVNNNRFKDCDQTGGATAYACSATGGAAAGFPQYDFEFCHNYVENIPSWDMFMTHECDGIRANYNKAINVRAGIDITTSTGTIKNVQVIGNDIEGCTADTHGGAAAKHGAIEVKSEGVASAISNVSICDNTARNFNTVAGINPLAGVAISCISLSRAEDANVKHNKLLNLGAASANYAGVAIYEPGNSVHIDDNSGFGPNANFFVVVQQPASGLTTIDKLSTCRNTFISSGAMTNPVRFINGTFTDAQAVGNALTASGTPSNMILIDGTTPAVLFSDGPELYGVDAAANPPSLADGTGTTLTVSVPGARVGKNDLVNATFTNDNAGIITASYVSVDNVVAVRFQNETGGVLDLGVGELVATVKVRKR